MKQCTRIVLLLMLSGIIGGLLSSCLLLSRLQYSYSPEEKRHFPKTPKYRLKGQLLPGTADGKIDFNAIYVWESLHRGQTFYLYYRFWEDGHVLHRSLALKTMPTQVDAESFYGCQTGYYVIHDQTVVIELFTVDGGGVGYPQHEVELIEGGVINSCTEPVADCEPLIYRKVIMGELMRQPDW